MTPLYTTYTASTKHHGKQYFIESVTIATRTWTTNDSISMQFSTRKEVDLMIQMFKIQNAYVAMIPHYE